LSLKKQNLTVFNEKFYKLNFYAALYTHAIDKNFAVKITSKKAAQTARAFDDVVSIAILEVHSNYKI
jgi:dihydrodipicolinate reductase